MFLLRYGPKVFKAFLILQNNSSSSSSSSSNALGA